jgi:hypothetical protein
MHTSIDSIVAAQLIEDRIAAATAERQARELRPPRRHGPRESAVQRWLHGEAAASRPKLRRQRVQ